MNSKKILCQKIFSAYDNYRRCLYGNIGEMCTFQTSLLNLGSSTLEDECQNRSILSAPSLFLVTCTLQIDKGHIRRNLGLLWVFSGCYKLPHASVD